MSSTIKQYKNKLYQLKQIKYLINLIALKIVTLYYISLISKLDYCNALLNDIPKLQEKIP